MQILAKSPDRADALAEAFTATEYVVETSGAEIRIRIGQTTPALDSLLQDRPWAVITAYNPDGVRRPAVENTAAQSALEQCLHLLRPARLLKVCNRDPAGNWPEEPAWLFTPDHIRQADRLARRFDQRAVVAGHPGGPATLRMYADAHADRVNIPTVIS